MRRSLFAFTLLVPSLAVSQSAPPKLTDAEALTLKNSMLEQSLAKAQQEIARLHQQLLLQSLYQAHGWKPEEVSIRLRADGSPEAFQSKKDGK